MAQNQIPTPGRLDASPLAPSGVPVKSLSAQAAETRATAPAKVTRDFVWDENFGAANTPGHGLVPGDPRPIALEMAQQQAASGESPLARPGQFQVEAVPQVDYAHRNYFKFYDDTNTRQGGLAERTQLLASSGGAGSAPQSGATTNNNPGSPAASNDGWHVDFTPYLWMSGIHGTTGVQGRTASIHASFGDVLDYLNLGLMAVTEVRYNRILVPVDFMWIKLTDKQALPEEAGPTSAKAEFKQTILTPNVGYRIIDGEMLKVDGVVGIRYWHLSSSLDLQPSDYGSFSGSASWVDVLGGGRIEAILTPKLSIAVLGDAGGAQADSDYDVTGLIGFRIAKKWTLLAGYRYLSVNYRPSSTFIFNNTLSGIALGATWNIK